jgi:hypothetical protein
MEVALDHPPKGPAVRAPRRRHRASKPQLLTRAQLDGRTNAAKVFDRLISNIEADLGGRDQLSTIERALIEGFAGAALTLHHLNAKLAIGEPIDLGQHAQAVSAMVRVASRLGLQRRAKDVGPTLSDLLRADLDEQRAAAAVSAMPDTGSLTTDDLGGADDHPSDEEDAA